MSVRDPFVNVPEAGKVLGVSESTIWRMIRRGTLPSIQKGGRRVVPRRALVRSARKVSGDRIPPLTSESPILRLIGAGRSGGRAPGARDKHAVLDE